MIYNMCPSMLKLSIQFFVLTIFLFGCSSSYTVSSLGKPIAEYSIMEMNEELRGQDVKIEMKDGRDQYAKEVKISDDSLLWLHQRTDEKSKASIREINRIVLKSRGTGALEGLGLGLAGGGGLGALVGQVIVGNDGEWGTGAGAFVGLILGGGTGAIVGSITGLIVGHRYKYEFHSVEVSDSLQNGK